MRGRRRSTHGFTLIEVVVAAAALVLAAAGFASVVQTAIRQRIHAENLGAATALATLQIERLVSLARVRAPDLDPGEHGPLLVDAGGGETVTGPFEIRWTVSENPLPIAFPRARRIRVSARHLAGSGASSEIETTLAVP